MTAPKGIAALVAELRALAEKATPEPHAINCTIATIGGCSCGETARSFDASIALNRACSPDVILRLCAALESEYARAVKKKGR